MAPRDKAGTDRLFAQRVRLYRLSYERLDAFLRMLEAQNRFDFVAANNALDRLFALTHTLRDFRLYFNPSGNDPVGKLKPQAHIPAAPASVIRPSVGRITDEGDDD